MLRKSLPYLLAILVILGLAAAYVWRPVTIQDGEHIYRLRPAVLKVGQALYAGGLSIDPADRVTPGLDDWAPLNGEIQVERAKTIQVWENGQIQSVTSFADSPAEVLAEARLDVGEHDQVTWNGLPLDLSMPLKPGGRYVWQIDRAIPLQVVVDGETKSVESFGPTVGRGVWDAGMQIGPGDQLSAALNAPLQANQTIEVKSARPIAIHIQGEKVLSRSAAATVGQALTDAGVTLQDLDYTQPNEDQPLPEDGQIQVVRVTEEMVYDQKIVPFESTAEPDPELELDQRRTKVAGQYGIEVTRQRVRYEDNQEVSRVHDLDWTATEPQPQVLGYGTKVVPYSLDTPDGAIEYYRAVNVYATKYSPCRLGKENYCNDQTSSGQKLTKGMIAVTLPWYRLLAGSRVYVPGYGFGVIADVGGGIPGQPWIDLGYDENSYPGGSPSYVTLYLLTPAPANVPWALP